MKAILFAAKSTLDVRGSIPDQLADGRVLAAQKGYAVVAEYSDEAASAYSGDRGPGLAQALEHGERISAEDGSSALIVQHSDRLARGDAKQARHLIEIVLWAIKHDVALHSVQDPEMLAGGELQLLMGAIGGMRNHQDSKRKSQAAQGGMKRRAQRGRHNGGPRPYGYQWERDPDGEGKRLAVHEPEAVVVRRIYAEYLAGRGQREIARGLIADGITAQRGGTWHQGTIARMLGNVLYAGHVHLNDELYDGEHEAAVDPETWEQARQLREALQRTPGKGRGRHPTGQHLFRQGHLRCGTCGDAMIAVTKPTRTPGRLYEAYACFGRTRLGVDHCPQLPIPRALVDTAVWQFFERVALDVDATRVAISAQADAQLAELDALRDQAERDAAKAERALAKVKRDYLEGDLSASAWQGFHDDLTADREAARAQLERLDARRQQVASEAARLDAEDTVMRELTLIRAAVAGQVKDGQAGVDAFRAALMRLFARFEVVRFPGLGVGGLDGTVVHQGGAPVVQQDGQPLFLVPHVRAEAIDWTSPEPDFPALRRAVMQPARKDAKGLET
jgi:site-specific DNA recombinase